MVVQLGSIIVGNELGLYAFLALIPFFIIYLIRPRPKQLNVPSLMFLMKQSGITRFTSFLRNFVKDWLFLIQLIGLLALIGILLSPFFYYDHDITAQNTVIVIDASASAQVKEGSSTRFDIAVSKAKESLGQRNTIILAKEVPLIGVKDVSSSQALEYLDDIVPRDTTTRLGDAIILAGETLAGKEGRVVVFSDFVNTGGQNPETAKLVLESKGIVVDFVNTGSSHDNVGFVELSVGPDSTIAYVQNFGSSPVTVSMSGPVEKELYLEPDSKELVAFQTPTGIVKLRLSPTDDFPLDNEVIISGPAAERTKALLVTNNRSVFLLNALRATPFVDVTVAVPPIVPKEYFDVFVLHNLDPVDVLPGTLEQIARHVENGAVAIVHAQNGMVDIKYAGLFTHGLEGFVGAAPVIVEQTTQFTKNADFGVVNGAYNVSVGAATSFMSVAGSPVLTLQDKGEGSLVYFGILESESDFRLSPSYPIFWNELLKSLTGQVDVAQLNFRTDKTLLFDEVKTIVTPVETLRRATMLLEEQGEYKVGDRVYVANLLSEAESDVSPREITGEQASKYSLQPVTERRKYDLETKLIMVAFAVLFFELLFIKLRGDV
ncbi:hypothetical protein GF342_00540 [Candidatus Woesearchaeota archaeon]|nr:hypothetical protein [Candidatus Woesearchaeota archaeon]